MSVSAIEILSSEEETYVSDFLLKGSPFEFFNTIENPSMSYSKDYSYFSFSF